MTGRTPKQLRAKDGTVYWRVRYRRAGAEHALSFWGEDAEDEAHEFVALINSLGADRAVAYWNANLEKQGLDLTVDDWFTRYLRAVTGITEGTRLNYRRIYDRVWSPRIGRRPLDLVTREDIAAAVNEMSEQEGKADKTVANHYGVIASAFKVAVRDNVIPSTPCADIRLPRRTEHADTEMRFLTHDEWALLERTLPKPYVPLFTTLIGTGMRWGEAEALEVADVVLEPDPVVRISKAAKWNAGRATREVGPTKTKRSKRTVTLPLEVVEVLTPLLERPRRDRLFLAARGGELRHSKVYEAWIAACEKAQLGEWVKVKGKKRRWEGPRIHDLRHTHASWLIAAGVPLPVIQARLGHESIKTTIDRYGHLLPDLQRAAAEAASMAMRPRVTVGSAAQPLPAAE